MLYTWDDQSIRWFADASAVTGFHKALAKKIMPWLEPGDMLCDAGCGLGRLDFELAPYVSQITAVDLDGCATAALRLEIARAGIQNMRVYRGDVTALPGRFDVILMSFFGQPDIMEFLRRARRKLIRIVGAGTKSGLYPERHRQNVKNTVPLVQEELAGLGVPFELELCAIEFGQPLRSIQDARLYILKNAPGASPAEVDGFLEERLTRTGREDFPLYLPYRKELGIFVIDTGHSPSGSR